MKLLFVTLFVLGLGAAVKADQHVPASHIDQITQDTDAMPPPCWWPWPFCWVE